MTGGALDQPTTAIADAATKAIATGWTAPASAATLQLALILRDSRGGSDIARATLTVVGP